MYEIRTEVEIEATPEEVWAILSDVDGWSSWNTTVHASSGQFAQDAQMDITMKNKKGDAGPHYKPMITTCTPPFKMRWRAKMMAGFIFTNDKLIEISATESGCKVTHSELFGGLMFKMMSGAMKTGVPPILDAMNRDLKSKAES